MSRPLNPTRALLHPLWWAALALLLVNDHVLKHIDVLPSLLTGKLSDLAGLLVAPALLAVVLRLRRRGTVLAVHLAVAAVFVALQLSTGFAGAWGAAFDALAFGWRTWSDPTDLVVLPVLAVSWRVLVRGAMAVPGPRHDGARHPLQRAWHRAAITVGVGVGALACVATSAVPPNHATVPGDPNLIEADAYLYNATGSPMDVRVLTLSDGVSIDCERLAAEPAAVLRENMFTRDAGWQQPTGESAAIWPMSIRTQTAKRRGCWAALVEVADAEPVYVTWSETGLPLRGVPLKPAGLDALVPGAVTVEQQGEAIALCAKGNLQIVAASR